MNEFTILHSEGNAEGMCVVCKCEVKYRDIDKAARRLFELYSNF